MKILSLERRTENASEIFENQIVCEWLSSAQTSQYLGVTENALRIMVYRRQIKFSKFGRRLRFHINDVKSLLRKGQ